MKIEHLSFLEDKDGFCICTSQEKFYAVSTTRPRFCFEAGTPDAAADIAERALALFASRNRLT